MVSTPDNDRPIASSLRAKFSRNVGLAAEQLRENSWLRARARGDEFTHHGAINDAAISVLGNLEAMEEAPEQELARTLFRKTRDNIRTEFRRRDRFISTSTNASEPSEATEKGHEDSYGRDPVETFAANDEVAQVLQAVGSLPDTQRYLVIERAMNGTPYSEISAATGVQVGTLKVRYSRALAALRSALTPASPIS